MFFLKQLPSDAIMSVYARRFPEMDKEATLSALRMLQQASFLMRELERLFAGHGLSQTRFLILIVLEREGGKLTGTEIRDRIDISRPVLTKTLRGLKREGFVKIAEAPDDARALLVSLTEGGASKLREVLPDYFNVIKQHMRSGDGFLDRIPDRSARLSRDASASVQKVGP